MSGKFLLCLCFELFRLQKQGKQLFLLDKLIFGHIFQFLYFANLFKIRNLKKLSLLKGGNAEWSVACDDGIFIFPKYRIAAPHNEYKITKKNIEYA